MGGVSERVCGSCIFVQISWQIFFLSFSLSFFIPADFFIRLEGRRPSVTKHCVLCRVGGGDKLGWGGGGWV